jgi:ribonuclease HII
MRVDQEEVKDRRKLKKKRRRKKIKKIRSKRNRKKIKKIKIKEIDQNHVIIVKVEIIKDNKLEKIGFNHIKKL